MAEGVDVLLTDKNLPDGSGLELMAEARAADEDVEVLLITGYASLDTAIAALQQGAFDYIVKPPESIFDVRRKVEQAFAKQAVVRDNRRLVRELAARNEALETALAELSEARDELVQAEKLAGIGTLAAGIAHEIGSPLFGVLGLAEAIEDEDELSTIRSHAAEIVQYATAISEIVGGLGSYTRRADPEQRPVDLADVVQQAVRLVHRARPDDEAEVVVEVPDGLVVMARPTELQQVVVNLVRNALDALDGPGHVWVRGRAEGGDVVFEVADDGPGIPEADQGQVFDPFFTTKQPGEGTGLGLNIVYRLVTRHQGRIGLQSARGQGATFTVRLPQAPAEVGAA